MKDTKTNHKESFITKVIKAKNWSDEQIAMIVRAGVNKDVILDEI